MGYLDIASSAAAKDEMQVDAPAQAGPVQAAKKGSTTSTRPGTPASSKKDEELIPEVDIYITLLVIVHLLDQKQLEKVKRWHLEAYDDRLSGSGIRQSKELADATVARLGSHNRRTLDQLAAKVYFYYGRLHELVGGPESLSSIRPCAISLSKYIYETRKLTITSISCSGNSSKHSA